MSLDAAFASVTTGTLTLGTALLCTAVSLALGLACAAVYMYRATYTKSFVVTLALLPAIVQAVIMLVNGNLGTGVAVMGAFSLVRFRSVAGTAREICSLFLAMAIGLAMGTGYILFAVLFTVILGGAMLLYGAIPFGEPKRLWQELKITIPENLDYEGIFDDLFAEYTDGAELQRVRTTNMGSLYELTYCVRAKAGASQKAFLDALRCRNGNLNIVCGRPPMGNETL